MKADGLHEIERVLLQRTTEYRPLPFRTIVLWMGKAEDRAAWYALEEAYVQQWKAVG